MFFSASSGSSGSSGGNSSGSDNTTGDSSESGGDDTTWLGSIGDIIRSAVTSALSGLLSLVNKVISGITDLKNSWRESIVDYKAYISTEFDNLWSAWGGYLNACFNDLSGWITGVKDSIWDGINNIGQWFSNLITNLGQWFADLGASIGEWFTNLITNLGQWFSNAIDNIVDFKDSVIEWFAGFFIWLWELFLGLFIPDYQGTSTLAEGTESVGYFARKNNELLDLLQSKLKYNELINPWTSIKNITSSTPPNITCTLYGQTFTIIDWSYMLEFRPTIYFWVRGFYYPLFLIYQYNQVYKLIRGSSYVGNGKSGGEISGQMAFWDWGDKK